MCVCVCVCGGGMHGASCWLSHYYGFCSCCASPTLSLFFSVMGDFSLMCISKVRAYFAVSLFLL